MMTCIGARRSSKFSQTRPPTVELAAFERLKKSTKTNNGKNGVTTFHDQILFILAGKDDINKSLDEF